MSKRRLIINIIFRFLFHSIIRPLTIGVVQLSSDYFFKPLLAVLFNGIIQPILIFVYNIATSLRDISKPVADSVGFFIREVSEICKSIRFVEIHNDKKQTMEKEFCKHKKNYNKCNNNNGNITV